MVFVFDDAGSSTNRYLPGDVVDQVSADETSSEVLWALTDNQGTVRDIANYDPTGDTACVDNHRKFDDYGNIPPKATTRSNSATPTPAASTTPTANCNTTARTG